MAACREVGGVSGLAQGQSFPPACLQPWDEVCWEEEEMIRNPGGQPWLLVSMADRILEPGSQGVSRERVLWF